MTANTVPQGLFGPGILYVTRTDIANGTPYNIGYCNEFSYDMKATIKELYGQNSIALLAAAGTKKISGKIKAATLSGQALNSLMLTGTVTAGTQYDLTASPSTAIPATPFTITPTVPNTGTWDHDLGVVNAATMMPLQQVASAPAAGQYSVAAGVYTFSSADHVSGISVFISFVYSYTTAPGMTILIPNTQLGNNPSFQIDYKTALYGATYMATFFAATCSGWNMAHKLEDFVMPEFDFSLFCNAQQQLGRISLATQA